MKADRNNIITIESRLGDHYDRLTERYVEIFFNDRTDFPWLDKFLKKLPAAARILDVGCGPGNFAAYLCQKRFVVTGVDISQKMIRTARRKVPEAAFKIMTMRNLKFRENTFSGLLSAYSFLHIPRKYAGGVLDEFQRVLKPDGILALIVKRGKGAHNLPSPIAEGEHCFAQLWDYDELLQLLRKSGFELVSQESSEPNLREELPFVKMYFLLKNKKPIKAKSRKQAKNGFERLLGKDILA